MNFDGITFHGTFRSYQQRILDDNQNYFIDNKLNIVAAPGSGKTILGLELIRRLNSPCIIFSPTTTIKNQWGERFADFFLDDKTTVDNYVSFDLNKILLINSVTYQALYSAINKISIKSDEEEIDYSNIDLFKLIKQNGIKTICLDEAHHLQNQWQKSLETFISGLDEDIKIISLTATPPYDANPQEWNRYISVCGEIDEEIFVPELVKRNELCPHQDYIYFNYPTKEECESFERHNQNVVDAINKIADLQFLNQTNEKINQNFDKNAEEFYSFPQEYMALFVFFEKIGLSTNKKIKKKLMTRQNKNFDTKTAQLAVECLLKSKFVDDSQKEEIIKILKEYSVYEKKQVIFDLNDKLKKQLISSVGKLESIKQIVKIESTSLQENLRMLILTDYIKKESISSIGSKKQDNEISVVSIFNTLQNEYQGKLAILSGSLIILPTDCEQYLSNIKFSKTELKIPNYAVYNFSASNKQKVANVSKLFEDGKINILIGTKSLLGEGWDSPSINTLILASFVGSFMLSNQMRGRAIRIDKKHPNKVANIWHLVTIEPDYIYQNNKLMQKIAKMNENKYYIKSADYDALKRRFECFVAPNYSTGEIESGISRLDITEPFTKEHFDQINKNMAARATNRQKVAQDWQTGTFKSSKIDIQTQIPKQRKVQKFAYTNIFALLLVLTANIFVSNLVVNLIKKNNNFVSFTLSVLCVIVTIFLLNIIIPKIIAHFSPKNSIKTFASCILKTLKHIGQIDSPAKVRIETSDNMSFDIKIDGATMHEQNVFNTAIKEFFSPIENPRYIVVKSRFGKFDYKHSFACPTIIGKNKQSADVFRENIAHYCGKFCLVFTRTEASRKIMLKCQKLSYITLTDKLVTQKYKISSSNKNKKIKINN